MDLLYFLFVPEHFLLVRIVWNDTMDPLSSNMVEKNSMN